MSKVLLAPGCAAYHPTLMYFCPHRIFIVLNTLSIMFMYMQADKDPVIQIANVVKVQGCEGVVAKNVFTLGGCTPIVDAHVITNETEDELLWKVTAIARLLCHAILIIRMLRRLPFSVCFDTVTPGGRSVPR